jgi:Zn-dependent protease with chaperone function
MDFFAHQDRARRQTGFLILAFVFALITIVVAVDVVVLTAVTNMGNGSGELLIPDLHSAGEHSGLLMLASLATAVFIAMASLFRIATLGSGGARVARSLGGTRVTPDTPDPLRRRLHNVVEEMAIASGVPVPEVYVLEQEPGLNAFAAGFTPGDAAIAVTRGSLESFSRNELQGVIAHEFSHILNGDMRLNMRLMGLLFGILAISLIGRTILRGTRHARFRSSRPKGGGGGVALVVAVGVALTVIGWAGLLLTRLIKAGISRQREYLADASAVQFTRQTAGIADALKKIGYGATSVIQATDGEEVSHMLFANGLRALFNPYATHPPIEQRIKALEPGFDPATYISKMAGRAAARETGEEEEPTAAETRSARAQWNHLMESLLILTPDVVTSAVGNPNDEHIRHAAELRRLIPPPVYQSAQSDRGAPLLTMALLLDESDEVRMRQLERLSASFSAADLSRVIQLHTAVRELGPPFRLPLLELGFPTIRQRPREQTQAFLGLVDELVRADGRVDTFEYLLSRTLVSHLRDADLPARPGRQSGVTLVNSLDELHTLFCVVARLGHREGDEAARDACQAGMLALLPGTLDWPEYDPPAQWVTRMDTALDKLDRLPSMAKAELVKALTNTISHDGAVTVGEAELLRAVCTILHCPLPPFPPGMTGHRVVARTETPQRFTRSR